MMKSNFNIKSTHAADTLLLPSTFSQSGKTWSCGVIEFEVVNHSGFWVIRDNGPEPIQKFLLMYFQIFFLWFLQAFVLKFLQIFTQAVLHKFVEDSSRIFFRTSKHISVIFTLFFSSRISFLYINFHLSQGYRSCFRNYFFRLWRISF